MPTQTSNSFTFTGLDGQPMTFGNYLGNTPEAEEEGDGLTPIDWDAKPDKLNASVLRRKQDIYQRYYVPQEQRLIDSLNDNKIVERAEQTTDKQFDRNAGSLNRTMGRSGIDLTPAQQQQLDRKRELSKTSNKVASINNARLDQRERNTDLRNQVINLGRDVETSGADSLGESAVRQANRDSVNRQAKAQGNANTLGLITGLASTAMMAFTNL